MDVLVGDMLDLPVRCALVLGLVVVIVVGSHGLSLFASRKTLPWMFRYQLAGLPNLELFVRSSSNARIEFEGRAITRWSGSYIQAPANWINDRATIGVELCIHVFIFLVFLYFFSFCVLELLDGVFVRLAVSWLGRRNWILACFGFLWFVFYIWRIYRG